MEKARTSYFLSNDTFQVFCEAVVRLLHNVVCKDKDKVFDKVLVAPLVIKGPGKRGHIVADTLLPTQTFPRLPARNICCGHKFCVRDTKSVSDFVQKQFVSATNVSQFAQPHKHHGQQCVRNNVSSFTKALTPPSVVTVTSRPLCTR